MAIENREFDCTLAKGREAPVARRRGRRGMRRRHDPTPLLRPDGSVVSRRAGLDAPSPSYDAIVTTIHRQESSRALRRQESGRRLYIDFEPTICIDIPRSYQPRRVPATYPYARAGDGCDRSLPSVDEQSTISSSMDSIASCLDEDELMLLRMNEEARSSTWNGLLQNIDPNAFVADTAEKIVEQARGCASLELSRGAALGLQAVCAELEGMKTALAPEQVPLKEMEMSGDLP